MAIKWNKRNIFRAVWFSLVTVFFLWNWNTFQSHNLPEQTFENSPLVRVIDSGDKISFQSVAKNYDYEIILFQGGLTDPKAYAPLCRKIAEEGFSCHVIKMGWRLPQYDYQKVTEIFDLESGNYIIGGHSQGGKMAAQLVYENPTLFRGLYLMGTSHPRDIDLSSVEIPTLKFYAEHDGLASIGEVMENKNKLPNNSEVLFIEGGNHSQFGYLGTLFMDGNADISIKNQQEQTYVHLIDFFNRIVNNSN